MIGRALAALVGTACLAVAVASIVLSDATPTGGRAWLFVLASAAGWGLVRYAARGRRRPPPFTVTVHDDRLW